MKAMRIIGYVLAGVTVTLMLAVLIGEGVTDVREKGFSSIDSEVWFVIVPTLVVLAAFVLSWWRIRAGGLALIAGYLVYSFSPTVLRLTTGDGFRIYPAIWLFMLPLLVSGALLVLSTVYSRKLPT